MKELKNQWRIFIKYYCDIINIINIIKILLTAGKQ